MVEGEKRNQDIKKSIEGLKNTAEELFQKPGTKI